MMPGQHVLVLMHVGKAHPAGSIIDLHQQDVRCSSGIHLRMGLSRAEVVDRRQQPLLCIMSCYIYEHQGMQGS